MQMRRSILIVPTVLIAIAGIAWFAFLRLEPARMDYDVHGIDVSHHQGAIDWPSVAKTGAAFVFMKATEGGDFIDPRFAANWRDAGKAGLLRGAYHFFSQCRPGLKQAENFISAVPDDPAALPPVIDAEHMGPCTYGKHVTNVAVEIRVMLDRLAKHYRKRPVIYTTTEFHDAYLAKGFDDERFWIRSIVTPPGIRKDTWLFWQYHFRGSRAGIDGPVDLNVFRGNREELAALARPGGKSKQ